MNPHDTPDEGLTKAMGLSSLPSGKAYDFGTGMGDNLVIMAKRYPGAIGFDLVTDNITKANKRISQEGVTAEAQTQDVHKIEILPNSLAVISVGMLIYIPKGMVEQLLHKVYSGLKANGILHTDFATTNDSTLEDDFVQYTCAPYPENGYENSFYHHCGSPSCWAEHPGVLGGSYWTVDEANKLLSNLGKVSFIHNKVYEWDHVIWEGENGDDEIIKRSFYRATVQKM